jgi:hypothetical protein
MRIICLFTVAISTLFASQSAYARPLTACDFIDQANVERLLGDKVSPPEITDMNVCAGLCPSLNASRCGFKSISSSKEVYLEVALPPYAFDARQERTIFESERVRDENIESVPGFGGNSFWYYRGDVKQSLFFAYPRGHLHFTVQEIGLEPQKALSIAIAITRAALTTSDDFPSAEMKNAFVFHTAAGTYHPWRR